MMGSCLFWGHFTPGVLKQSVKSKSACQSNWIKHLSSGHAVRETHQSDRPKDLLKPTKKPNALITQVWQMASQVICCIAKYQGNNSFAGFIKPELVVKNRLCS